MNTDSRKRTNLRDKEAEKRKFFKLAHRLMSCADARQQQRIKQELARMTFGN